MTSANAKVIERIETLCEVLRSNYQSYAISSHRLSIQNGNDVEYHQKRIDELSEGIGLYTYTYTIGRKYAKIIMNTSSGSKSAHAFVDVQTGDLYKASSWSAPAKGIRYNLLNDESLEEVYKRADWAGGWTYAR